jgi:hypothetical protein
MSGFVCSFRREPAETECWEAAWSEGEACAECDVQCYRSGWPKSQVDADNARRVAGDNLPRSFLLTDEEIVTSESA